MPSGTDGCEHQESRCHDRVRVGRQVPGHGLRGLERGDEELPVGDRRGKQHCRDAQDQADRREDARIRPVRSATALGQAIAIGHFLSSDGGPAHVLTLTICIMHVIIHYVNDCVNAL